MKFNSDATFCGRRSPSWNTYPAITGLLPNIHPTEGTDGEGEGGIVDPVFVLPDVVSTGEGVITVPHPPHPPPQPQPPPPPPVGGVTGGTTTGGVTTVGTLDTRAKYEKVFVGNCSTQALAIPVPIAVHVIPFSLLSME